MIITGFFLDQEHRAWGKIRFVFDCNKKVSNFHENVSWWYDTVWLETDWKKPDTHIN